MWEVDTYLAETEEGPGRFIDLHDIVAHAVLAQITIEEQPAWATIRINQVCSITDLTCIHSTYANINLGWGIGCYRPSIVEFNYEFAPGCHICLTSSLHLIVAHLVFILSEVQPHPKMGRRQNVRIHQPAMLRTVVPPKLLR